MPATTIEVIEVNTEASEYGPYPVLVIKGKEGKTYKKNVFDKDVKAAVDGPGHYEVIWEKNEKGYFNIKFLKKITSVVHTPSANGSATRTYTADPNAQNRDRAIMAQVAMKEGVNLLIALSAKAEKPDPDKVINCAVLAARTFFTAMTRMLENKQPENEKKQTEEQDAELRTLQKGKDVEL
ncbi:MAG: hypothetical protein QME66_05915 [Candidatus Eisenbacteria bacterium]|nr:hypothetical protein [Candidatus Eisenbacteria bacterium]